MKKLSFFVAALFSAVSIWSQTPVNDNCAGLIDLGYAPACPPDTFTNINATASDIGFDNAPSCFNGNIASRDVWFMFTCPDTAFDFRITLTGVGANSILNPEFAVYRGDCQFDGMAELLCAIAGLGENSLFLDVTGLTPGLPYFIRVSDYSATAAPNWGNFTLCVTEIPPASNVDDGGSSLCMGTLYDSGGVDGDYGPNENHTFVICPNQPNSCITFTLQYYNIDYSGGFGGDQITFYDGDNTSAPILDQITGAGGGVCFQVFASSGCLTVQFTSDGSVEFEGFQGSWECTQQACPVPEVISVNPNITQQEIINAVSTPGTLVTITDIECASGAYGTFQFPTDGNPLDMEKGLILTSGGIDIAIGPNSFTGASQNNLSAGDADLDYLSVQQGNGFPSFDACVVELDVYVKTNQMSFEYVFGSEEYPEYVNTQFNDIFAFLVSGPGIAGDPGLNNALNISTIPGSNDPVQINSVNQLLNWEYYRNNYNGNALEYDGLTSDFMGLKKSLTAQVDVTPCNTYHLKLAVADRGDGVFDSGVFISEIKGGTPDINVAFASGIDYFIEDCSGNQDQLVISLTEPAEALTTITVNISGTATLGVDYILNVPPVVTFQPGQQHLYFPIIPIIDLLPEGTETIIISLSNNFGCGEVIYETLSLTIADNVVVNINGGLDTIFVCAGATLQLQAHGAVQYFWTPPGVLSDPFIGNPTITPTQDVWLSVLGTVGVLPACFDVDSVYIHIIDPDISVVAAGPTNICQGTTVQLYANNNVNNSGLIWSPVAGLDNPTIPNPLATPGATTTYTATVTIAGCTVSDAVTISVDTLFFPQITTTDTTICQNYSVQLASMLNSTTDYQWTPATGLNAANISGPLATPEQSTVYTFTATSANGYCSKTETVNITVIPADVDIAAGFYHEICLGDTVQLTANFAPAGPNSVQWSPAFYVSNVSGPNTVATPDESTTIYATYNVGGCLVRDSVFIRVDSVPQTDIFRVEDKAIYCVGDTIYLISPTYEPASFPDIAVEWETTGFQLTPTENWNMVIIATETLTFRRIVDNRACTDTSSVLIPVDEPPTFTISADPDEICPGEQVQLSATVTPPQTLEWMDPSGVLSCTDCPNPVATPFGTTTFTVTAPEAVCPAGASITVSVISPPALLLSPGDVICPGESVLLNQASEPGVTYNWTSVPPGFVSNEPGPVVAPAQTTTYKVLADNGSCTSEGEVTVTPVSADVDLGADIIVCRGSVVDLQSNATGTPGTFFWRPEGQMTQDIQVSPDATTEYSVTLAYGDNCVATDTLVLFVLPNPELNLPGDTTICRGNSVLLNDITELGVTYLWTSIPPGFNSVESEPLVTPQDTTTYIVTATIDSCVRMDTVTVYVPFATVDAGPDQTVCLGNAVTLTAAVTGQSGGAFEWIPGGNQTPAITVTPADTQTYAVTYTYGSNCQAVDVAVVNPVGALDISDITAVPDSSNICEGAPLKLKVTVMPPGATLVWTANDVVLPGLDTDSITIIPEVQAGNTVSFDVVATDAFGCSASPDPYTVMIDRCYFIPSAFTPNNDGDNDTFGLFLRGGEVEIITFEIYNRWGEKVFESDRQTVYWDGKFNGNDAVGDVYIYVMTVRFPDDTVSTLKGDVLLVR